jgi:inhibitor of KinA sporulation pathway (predicted exonuclease)
MSNKEFKPFEIFTSLDLEMNQPSGRIIQVGAVVGNIFTGEILDRLSVFVNPHEELNPEIIKLTKIKQEQADNGVTLEEAYHQLKSMHLKHKSFVNCITWGGGDSKELGDQLKAENPNFTGWCFGRRWIDVKTLFVSWRFANRQPIQGGLARSMAKIGLNYQGHAHDARWDAENTFHAYRKMLELLSPIQSHQGDHADETKV